MAIKPGADAAALNVLISIHWFDFPALSGWFFSFLSLEPQEKLVRYEQVVTLLHLVLFGLQKQENFSFSCDDDDDRERSTAQRQWQDDRDSGRKFGWKMVKICRSRVGQSNVQILTTFATSFHPLWIGQKLNQLNPKPMAAWDKVGLLKLAPSPWERLCQAGWWRRVCLGERRRRTVEWQEQFSPQVFFFFSVGSLFFLLLRFWLTFPGSLLFEFLGRKKRGIQEANFPNHKEKPLMKNVPFVGEGGGKLYTDYRREVTEW